MSLVRGGPARAGLQGAGEAGASMAVAGRPRACYQRLPMIPMEAGYAAAYGELYARHWWWRAREEYVLRWVRRVANGRRLAIFDVGCGDGLMWKALEPYGEVEGVEPDSRLISRDSPHRDRIEISSFPGRARPEQEGRYDLILMLDVLEHIGDDQAALEVVRRLLLPGGCCVLTVPALTCLWSAFDVMNGHFRRYHRPKLEALLREAGFDVVRSGYYYCWPVLPLLARRLLFKEDPAGHSSFVRTPPEPLNGILRFVSALEHRLASVVPLPFGSSILAVARAPARPAQGGPSLSDRDTATPSTLSRGMERS